METILRIIAGLAFLAFVVGMINPAVVKCKSRGKAALIYLGVFIVCVFIGAASMEDNSSIENPKAETQSANTVAEETSTEIPVLGIGSVYTMKYSNADVKISFDNVQVKRIPNNGINLILYLTIKNNSNDTFFISNCDWKLLDSDKVEIDYVEKKQVKKPNGGKPGFVVYYTNYSMMADTDISDIEKADA